MGHNAIGDYYYSQMTEPMLQASLQVLIACGVDFEPHGIALKNNSLLIRVDSLLCVDGDASGETALLHDELQDAYKAYLRTRDYCASNRHMITMCLHVCQVAIELEQWIPVLTYAQKALATPQNEDLVTVVSLLCFLLLFSPCEPMRVHLALMNVPSCAPVTFLWRPFASLDSTVVSAPHVA